MIRCKLQVDHSLFKDIKSTKLDKRDFRRILPPTGSQRY